MSPLYHVLYNRGYSIKCESGSLGSQCKLPQYASNISSEMTGIRKKNIYWRVVDEAKGCIEWRPFFTIQYDRTEWPSSDIQSYSRKGEPFPWSQSHLSIRPFCCHRATSTSLWSQQKQTLASQRHVQLSCKSPDVVCIPVASNYRALYERTEASCHQSLISFFRNHALYSLKSNVSDYRGTHNIDALEEKKVISQMWNSTWKVAALDAANYKQRERSSLCWIFLTHISTHLHFSREKKVK